MQTQIQVAESSADPRDKHLNEPDAKIALENLNEIQLPRESRYIERARRSISTEARQTNLVESIALFNSIPKKYEIKFDLPQLTDDDKQEFAPEKCQRDLSNIETAPVYRTNDCDALIVQGSSRFSTNEKVWLSKTKDESMSSNSSKTFLKDYNGHSVESEQKVEPNPDEILSSDQRDEKDRQVDHIMDRLVTMLLNPLLADTDQVDSSEYTQTNKLQNHERHQGD